MKPNQPFLLLFPTKLKVVNNLQITVKWYCCSQGTDFVRVQQSNLFSFEYLAVMAMQGWGGGLQIRSISTMYMLG